MNRLGDADIDGRLEPGWRRTTMASGDSGIAKTFTFADFNQAFGWMTRVAMVAETMNHHPEWRNVYRTVDVELTTHDVGGVTEQDFALASEMDRLAS